uniref:Uncharacterized protein n=1 Tax=Eutreptiella gymnastica TaxID=73025 RepID=A0A7S1JGM3_9EUGL
MDDRLGGTVKFCDRFLPKATLWYAELDRSFVAAGTKKGLLLEDWNVVFLDQGKATQLESHLGRGGLEGLGVLGMWLGAGSHPEGVTHGSWGPYPCAWCLPCLRAGSTRGPCALE